MKTFPKTFPKTFLKSFLALFVALFMLNIPQGRAEMESLTPVLYVEQIEPSLEFWEKSLGFERISEVPGEQGLAFVYLKQGGAEVMYQTYASQGDDNPAIAEIVRGGSAVLYIKVQNLEEIIARLGKFEVAVERRTTFYGADEIAYREPGGHLVTFAHFSE